MSRILCQSLLANYQVTFRLVAETIGQFTPDQWTEGVNAFQVPCKIAYHIVECLDYYFREDPDQPFRWGYRFNGAWWELPDEAQPTPEALLDYLAVMEQRISQHLSALRARELATPFDERQEHGDTRLGHTVYALRHTMHHHGALSLLSLTCGNPQGTWE